MRERLHAELTRAMKDRDGPKVAVLRMVLAAIANAEAVAGVRNEGRGRDGDDERRSLEPSEVRAIIEEEIRERETHVTRYKDLGQENKADSLRREIDILRGYLD